MVHSAYDSFELLNDCPTKIDAIESCGSKLLVGCSDGSLRIYSPESSGTDRCPMADHHSKALEVRKKPYVWVLKEAQVATEILGSRELLISLLTSIGSPIWRLLRRSQRPKGPMCILRMIGGGSYVLRSKRGFAFLDTMMAGAELSDAADHKDSILRVKGHGHPSGLDDNVLLQHNEFGEMKRERYNKEERARTLEKNVSWLVRLWCTLDEDLEWAQEQIEAMVRASAPDEGSLDVVYEQSLLKSLKNQALREFLSKTHQL